MPITILMPALSPTMTEGNLAKWLKKEGDKVKSGDVLAEIETDKATMEIETIDDGILAKIVVPEGAQNVAVNSMIALIIEDGEKDVDIDKFIQENSFHITTKEVPEVIKETKIEDKVLSKIVEEKNTNKIFASPLAKRIAESESIDLCLIKGSGPYNRIIRDDLVSFMKSSSQTSQSRIIRNSSLCKLIPITNIRRIIAKRLSESKQNIPHFYLSIDCNLDKLIVFRNDLNNLSGEKDKYKISVNDFVIKACARALADVPEANASWGEDGITQYNNIDISVAVAIDNGLVTPIIENADQKGIIQISNQMKDLAKRAKEMKLAPHEFQGGNFTISNLGMYGITNFSAIINPPQSCILSVGAAIDKAVVVDGEISISKLMTVTLSCDHRVVDGAVGARLLNSFKSYIENPFSLIDIR
jgi:pyruvate dehydrogenase E2 component (dihydrolipoamide acetyltransferase)